MQHIRGRCRAISLGAIPKNASTACAIAGAPLSISALQGESPRTPFFSIPRVHELRTLERDLGARHRLPHVCSVLLAWSQRALCGLPPTMFSRTRARQPPGWTYNVPCCGRIRLQGRKVAWLMLDVVCYTLPASCDIATYPDICDGVRRRLAGLDFKSPR